MKLATLDNAFIRMPLDRAKKAGCQYVVVEKEPDVALVPKFKIAPPRNRAERRKLMQKAKCAKG